MSSERPPLPRALRWALLAGILLSQALLWSFDPLPIVDLPEHAAQIALLRLLGDPAFPYSGQYELNLFTPYLLAYMLAAGFALALPIGLAFKATLGAIGLLWLWALLRFLRQVGADPWWALFAFPLFFGLSFVWGFLNYLLAVPLVLLLVAAAHGQARAPTPRGGLLVALLGILTFFAHGMACVFGMAIAGALALVLMPDWRQWWRALWPLLPPAAVVLGWRWIAAPEGVAEHTAWIPLWRRVSLHRRLLGDWGDFDAACWAAALLVLVISTLFAERRALGELPPRERWARRLPLLFTLAYLASMPEYLEPLAFAGSRFMVFVPLFAGWWLRPIAWKPLPRLLPLLAFGWLAFLFFRFGAESRQLASFRPILEALPPYDKVLMIRLGSGTSSFGIPLALHQPAWYTVEKGGQLDFSFAHFRTELVRYREGRQPQIPEQLSHTPWQYDVPGIVGGYYHFWLIYAPGSNSANLPDDLFRLRVRNGPWWLYEMVRAP